MSEEALNSLRVFPSSGVPLYRQIMDQVRSLMLSGQLRKGDLLPSVRSAASSLQINPMTVSRAYSMLESEGVVERIRGLGMRVCGPSVDVSTAERLSELYPLLEQVAGRAYQLGLSSDQVLSVLQPLLSQLPADAVPPAADTEERR